MLIHPEYGLWHAYRGALVFNEPFNGLPARGNASSPCDTCAETPCLSTCPANAFGAGTYDVPACTRHLRSPEGSDCMNRAWRARRSHAYHGDHALFHMDAFLGVRQEP